MIKDFEQYRKVQDLGDAITWEKIYGDGLTARVTIACNACTRANVRAAFEMQEQGCKPGIYCKPDFA
jgi:hypothetical protein